MERVSEAAIMLSKRKFALHDGKGQSEAEQIRVLTDEVNRIAKLLSALAERSGLADVGDPSYESGLASRTQSGAHRSDQVSTGLEPSPSAGAHPIVTVLDVRNVIRMRRLRDKFFPADIFADPAWDMLLDLTAARLSDTDVSVSSLCIAAAVPATTALRWIRTMTEAGLFIRHADPADGRRVYIGLSDEAADGMMRYFKEMKARPN